VVSCARANRQARAPASFLEATCHSPAGVIASVAGRGVVKFFWGGPEGPPRRPPAHQPAGPVRAAKLGVSVQQGALTDSSERPRSLGGAHLTCTHARREATNARAPATRPASRGRDQRCPSALGLSRSSTQMNPRAGTPACLGALRPHRRTARPPPPAQCARQPRMCQRASLKLVIYSPFWRHACARRGASAQGRPSAPTLRGARTAIAPHAHSRKNRAGPPANLPHSCGRCSARGGPPAPPSPACATVQAHSPRYTRGCTLAHRRSLARSLMHAERAKRLPHPPAPCDTATRLPRSSLLGDARRCCAAPRQTPRPSRL
jgi:hypothetical protein